MRLKAAQGDGASRPPELSQFGRFLQAYFDRDALTVLLVFLVARLLFMLLMPANVRSFDTFSWEKIADSLGRGENPYQTTPFLNWPPFWMQIIFVLSKMSAAYGIPFFRVLQIFLIAVEAGVVVLLIRMIRAVVPDARIVGLVILGMALNPAAILMTCQHCNFDIVVGFWVLLFVLSLLRYNRSNDSADWLCACLFLGLGILTKTVPLLLFPMLAGGFRRAAANVRLLGVTLVFGPVALGISILYVLSPVDIATKVIAYRSIPGFFGITGLIKMAGLDGINGFYHALFYLALIASLAFTAILFWRLRSIGDRATVLYAALFLTCIPVFGPGYATEYLDWFLPLLVATYAFFNGRWRFLLVCFGLILACTYLIECGAVGGEGTYIVNVWLYKTGSIYNIPPGLLRLLSNLESAAGQTLTTLPLFLSYLTLIVVGTRLLAQDIRNRLNSQTPPSEISDR